MALEIAGGLSFSSPKVILTNTTGDYDAVDNPTGYGAPNAEFSDYAHYAIIRKKNVNEVADVTLTLDSYDPLTATEFSSDRAVDGWYEGRLLDILKWDSATSYTGGTAVTGDAVYDDGVVYYCSTSNSNSKPSLNPSKWTTVTDLTTIEENESIQTLVDGRVTAYDADVYWSSQRATLSQRGQEDCECIDDKLKKRLALILYYIQNVLVADQLGNNTDGEWSVLRLLALGAKKKVT